MIFGAKLAPRKKRGLSPFREREAYPKKTGPVPVSRFAVA